MMTVTLPPPSTPPPASSLAAPRNQPRRRVLRLLVFGPLLLAVVVLGVFEDARIELRRAVARVRDSFAPVEVDLAPATARLRSHPEVGPAAPLPFSDARVVIHKRERRLDLFDGERLVKSYRVGLGKVPEGPKSRKGDDRTPEGDYFVCARNGRTTFHLFLGLNYPNAADAALGLREGRIDQATRDRIAKDETRRRAPSWETALGGAIGIHGGGAHRDWTWGCIALENEDVEEIWAATKEGTPVRIEP